MKEPPVIDQVFIRKLTDIIHSNLGNENFGVNELAHESGMSLYRLGRKLHSINNKTVNQFIREVRLKNALEMLQKELCTAAEASYRTGFSSPAYFNKCFHEFFGYTPGEVTKAVSEDINPYSSQIDSFENKKGKHLRRWHIPSLVYILILAITFVGIGIFVYRTQQKSGRTDNLEPSNDRISIAVMPFLNMTGDTIWDIWQEGIQQALISYFSHSNELRVTQKETVKTYINATGISDYASISPVLAGLISKKLDANIFIYGNIQKARSEIRLNAQIIETKTQDILQSFEISTLGNDEIVFKITDSLRKKMTNFLLISKVLKEFPEYRRLPVLTTNSPEAFRYFVYGNTASDNKAAIDWYLKALAIDSNFFLPMMGLSTAYSNIGMADQDLYWVVKYYNKKDQWPENIQISAKWAYANSFESPEERVKYLIESQQIDDRNPNSYHVLGYTYITMGQYEKAIPVLKKSLEIAKRIGKDYLKSQINWFYGWLGVAYHKTGQIKKEKRLYKEADHYSEDTFICNNRAVLSFSEGDTVEANRFIKKYIEVKKEKYSSSEADIAAGVGDIYNNSGIPEKAEKYYRQALSLEPENSVRMNYLAEFLIRSNRKLDEIPGLMDRAMKLSHNKTDYYNCMNTKGWSLYKQGKKSEALDILEKTWNEAPFKLYSIKSRLEEVRKTFAQDSR